MSNHEIERLERQVKLLAAITPSGATCDWGGCADEADGYRWSDVHGWLPVCPAHAEPGLVP